MVIGFEVDELTIEETLASDASIQVVLLENDSERNFSVGVYTVDGSAQGEFYGSQSWQLDTLFSRAPLQLTTIICQSPQM